MRHDQQQTPRTSRHRDWPLLIFGALLVLPWLNKPFHVDDADYLRIARQIRAVPWDPYGFELLRGGRWYHAGAVHPSPPLFCYALAALTATAGESELTLHIFSGLFVVLGAWLAGRLGRRLAGAPWPAAILIVASPMLLPGQNVMLDVPMIVLALASVEMQLASVDRAGIAHDGRRKPSPLACGLVLAAACLTKYPALLVAPALALHWHLTRRRVPTSWVAGLVLPILAWLVFAWIRYRPEPALQRALDPPTVGRLTDNAIGLLIILGATCLATPLALQTPWRVRGGWLPVLAAAFAAGACVAHRLEVTAAPAPRALELLLRALFGAAGALLLAGVAMALWRPLRQGSNTNPPLRDPQHPAIVALAAWLAAAVAFNLVIESTTVRHVLIALPPLVLLLLHFDHQCPTAPRRCALACALSLLLAAGLADADARFARSSRDLVDQLARRAAKGTTVYVAGEWAFAYYAQRAGLIRLHERVALTPAAAMLAVPRNTYSVALAQLPPDWHQRIDAADALTLSSSIPTRFNPLRTVAAGANYYDVGTRNLPWSLSTAPLEQVYLFPIRPADGAKKPKPEARTSETIPTTKRK